MNIPENILPEELDLIDRFLANELTSEEAEAFEKKLAEDTRWQSLVKEISLITIGIQEASLQEKLSAFHTPASTAKLVTLKQAGWKKWAVAASVITLVALGGWFLLNRPENEKLFANYYKPDPGLPVVMGENNKTNYTLYDGMIDYKEGNYHKAIEKWKSIGDQQAYTDTLNYYIGMANIAAGKMEPAIQYLNEVHKTENSVYTQKASWYLALTYLKLGKIDLARGLLKQMENDMQEAKELLDRIAH